MSLILFLLFGLIVGALVAAYHAFAGRRAAA